ncbi:MAG: hypothetical protein ACE5ER_06835 [Nitrospinaceae bacterium]
MHKKLKVRSRGQLVALLNQ